MSPMSDSAVKVYGRVGIIAFILALMLFLDDLFALPLAFVTGIPTEILVRYETAAFVFVCSLLVSRFIQREIYQGVIERRTGHAVPTLIGQLTGAAILFSGFCVIIAFVFKKDVSALLATGGISLMVVALALRDMLLAAFTGILLNFERPFKPGDLVRLMDKFQGRVSKVTWRTVTLQTGAGETVIVPNIALTNAVIVNLDGQDSRAGRSIEVVIDYGTSVESAERILYAAALGAKGIKLSAPPSVYARRLERDGVLYEVGFMITDVADAKKSEHAVIKSILQCMRDAGVRVTIPKSEIIQVPALAGIADRSLDSFRLVQQCRLFRGVPEELCRRIGDLLVAHHRPKGAVIVKVGEMRFSMFLVGEGMVKRVLANRDGSDLVEQRLISTEFFGRRALFSRQPQAATVTAETNVLLYEFQQEALAKLLAEDPAAIGIFANVLAWLSWREMRAGLPDALPDPATLDRLINLHRGQIETCYGEEMPDLSLSP